MRDPMRALALYVDYAGTDEGSDDPSVPLNQATYNVGRKISVRIVATNKPPMIAKAIGPQNTVGAIGIMPRTVDTAVSMIGPETGAAGIDGGFPDSFSLRTLRLDLADQDHRILGDHAQQRQDAENGNEAQRPARQQERRDDADQAERRYAEDQEQSLEAL